MGGFAWVGLGAAGVGRTGSDGTGWFYPQIYADYADFFWRERRESEFKWREQAPGFTAGLRLLGMRVLL